MELMREKWTDERLDDLNAKVDVLGRRMDQRFEGIDRRLDRLLLGLSTTFIAGFIGLGSLIVAQG
jgi:hypothetical protein